MSPYYTRRSAFPKQRSLMIGRVFPRIDPEEIIHPMFGDFFAGAAKQLSLSGYSIVFSRITTEHDIDTYKALKEDGVVDGLIIQNTAPNDDRIDMLTDIDLPFVAHGRASDIETPFDWVDIDHHDSLYQATSHLTKLNHKRIGFINSIDVLDLTERRAAGYRQALKEANAEYDPARIMNCYSITAAGFKAAQTLLMQHPRPTAIITSSLHQAFGARNALLEAGLEIGKDISIVTLDDDLKFFPNGEKQPIFTACRTSISRIGELAAQIILNQISTPSRHYQSCLTKGTIVIGNTTGPAPE